MKNIWNLTKKDIKIILKDRAAVMWLFILPVVFILIFAGLATLTYGKSSDEEEEDTRTPLAVVNNDPDGVLAARFLADLDGAGVFRVETTSLADAEARLNILKISRYIVIPAGFSTDLAQGNPVTVQVITHPDGYAQGNITLLQLLNGIAKDTSLELQLLDGIRQMGEMQAGNPEAAQVFDPEKTLTQARSQFERSRTTPLVRVTSRILAEEEKQNAEVLNLSTSSVPGMAVLFVFLAAATVARSIYEERKNGSLRRLMSAPLLRSELLLGKMLPIWLLTLVQIAVIFLFGALVLPILGAGRLGIGNNPLAWVVTSLVIALCSTSLGIFISAIARSEGQISGLSNALLWVAGFVGGALLPSFMIEQIPMLNVLSRFVPQSWATRAYYDILARGAGLVEVLPSLGMLLLFSGIFFFIGVKRFKFE
jgi:ABC-2 type transport system permease protein